MTTLSRRQVMRSGAALGAASLLSGRARADSPPPRYLFVVGAMGGASIIDSFLPVRESASANGATLATFADSLIARPAGSNLDCVVPLATELAGPPAFKGDFSQATFLMNHGADTAVMTVESSSVNHLIAQGRALTGAGLNRGRTVLEAAALTHGKGLPLPGVNMLSGGYAAGGRDPSLPMEGRQVVVTDPLTFAFGVHGQKGLAHQVPQASLDRARAARERLEAVSDFGRTFERTPNRVEYLELRKRGLTVESADLISKLMLLSGASLTSVGLSPSPQLQRLRSVFPALETDPFEAQAALAFLLVSSRVSAAVGLGVSNAVRTVTEAGRQLVTNAQLGFDYSHTNHRVTQSSMWSRVLRVTDGLVRLLKETEDTSRPGTSLWANSLVYVATDFGREKHRPSAGTLAWGSGHHLNNGVVLVSPLLKGNRVYGGVDPDTCLTYGFDRATGAPRPGTVMGEVDVYHAVCGALGVDYPGRVPMPALVK
ncbi:MAG: hypothetical protein SFW67_30775 [Myxococcaceae bacterium]|nr:hypothetical protein [Myxococcaceae bacterium]